VKRLAVRDFGEKAQGVELRGDTRNPEPEHFRVVFPGGDVDIVRCDDGSYWIHVRVDRPEDFGDAGEGPYGRVLSGRVDVDGRHTSDLDPGLLADPGLYHLAVRIGLRPAQEAKRRAEVQGGGAGEQAEMFAEGGGDGGGDAGGSDQ
jgi:hypothetical protein